MPVSSRKFQAESGTRRGDDGRASDTRRGFSIAPGLTTGNGALKENVDVAGGGIVDLQAVTVNVGIAFFPGSAGGPVLVDMTKIRMHQS